MFSQFSNITYTGTATSADNTDYSLSGTSRKVTFANSGETFIVNFDTVDVSSWDEITMQISYHKQLSQNDIMTIDIGLDTYTIESNNPGWNHLTIDATGYNSISDITFTGLQDGLIIFIDLLGYRKVDNSSKYIDVINAFKNKISLSYGVTTTTNADISAGSKSISFTSHNYIFENTQFTITEGANTETHKLIDRGTIDDTFTNAYSSGSSITANCPVMGENQTGEEPDPVCGVVLTDLQSAKHSGRYVERSYSSSKLKDYVDELGVTVYIECTSKTKLLYLVGQFNENYGKEFTIILDGEIVDVIAESSAFSDTELDNKPRMAYFYRIKPQAVTISKRANISNITINMESQQWN